MTTGNQPAPIKGDVDTAHVRRVSGTPGSDDGLIEIPLVGHKFRYHVRVDLSGPAPRLAELRIIADDPADIDPAAMKAVPVRRLTSAAAWFINRMDGAFVVVSELHEPERLTRPRPEQPVTRHLDDDHYRRVADLLMKARRDGAPSPRDAVAQQMNRGGKPIRLGTLDRWIAEAKRRGHLRRDWTTTTELD